MPVKEIHYYEFPEGSPGLLFYDWAEVTLTEEEKIELKEARQRQESFRSDVISAGDLLEIEEYNNSEGNVSGYVWKDKETFKQNKPNDPIWYSYWRRWELETGVIFKIIEEEC